MNSSLLTARRSLLSAVTLCRTALSILIKNLGSSTEERQPVEQESLALKAFCVESVYRPEEASFVFSTKSTQSL